MTVAKRTCKTCRFWSLGKDDWGECRMAKSEGGYPDQPTTMAIAEDCDSYLARLKTHQKFSCNQWSSN